MASLVMLSSDLGNTTVRYLKAWVRPGAASGARVLSNGGPAQDLV